MAPDSVHVQLPAQRNKKQRYAGSFQRRKRKKGRTASQRDFEPIQSLQVQQPCSCTRGFQFVTQQGLNSTLTPFCPRSGSQHSLQPSVYPMYSNKHNNSIPSPFLHTWSTCERSAGSFLLGRALFGFMVRGTCGN